MHVYKRCVYIDPAHASVLRMHTPYFEAYDAVKDARNVGECRACVRLSDGSLRRCAVCDFRDNFVLGSMAPAPHGRKIRRAESVRDFLLAQLQTPPPSALGLSTSAELLAPKPTPAEQLPPSQFASEQQREAGDEGEERDPRPPKGLLGKLRRMSVALKQRVEGARERALRGVQAARGRVLESVEMRMTEDDAADDPLRLQSQLTVGSRAATK
jgi:hypothetical protein